MMNLPDRIFEKIHFEPNTGCWLWTASRTPKGYGRVRLSHPRRMMESAHRVVYELLVGPIPDGREIDHLCRVRHCVNPSHLQPVEQRTNLLRGISPCAINGRKTHCIRGHPLSGPNLRLVKLGRGCRACKRLTNRERRHREAARRDLLRTAQWMQTQDPARPRPAETRCVHTVACPHLAEEGGA